MTTWRGGRQMDWPPISVLGWLLIGLRGTVLFVLIFGGLAFMLLLRLIERPLFGGRRPITPFITVAVCRVTLLVMGIKFSTHGHPMAARRGAVVANHSSWLDIFVLNARKRIYFVSKSEVAAWPGIGWLARATGTVFIRRDPKEAKAQTQMFEQRLLAGHKLLFFPEGTSSDGLRVLPFKSTLFGAFFAPSLRDEIYVQPVTVRYSAPIDAAHDFYGWWGDMDFGPHFLRVLAKARQGRVMVRYHPPVRVADFPDRKALAAHCEAAVQSGFTSPE